MAKTHYRRSLGLAETLQDPWSESKPSDESRNLEEFARKIDQLKSQVEAQLGEDDRSYVKKLVKTSRWLEIGGRGLLQFSFEPIGFSLGVGALWIHKQLETSEIGHSALHGAFEAFCKDEPELHAKTHRWKFPVDEASWRYAHNVRHHSFTNVAGRDPDIHFGVVRLTPEVPHRWINYIQVPITMFVILPNFGNAINAHVTGLLDIYLGNGQRSRFDFIKSRDLKTVVETHKKAFRKWVPYYVKDYVVYPALAGPFFWKVMYGNWLADRLRDIYTGTTILCGHVGSEVKSSSSVERNLSRGAWYALQVESANNFKVPKPLSILCGGLDYQIEHHLFPKLPPHQLRKISRSVQEICDEHGISYRTESWPKTIAKTFSRLAALSRPKRRDKAEH